MSSHKLMLDEVDEDFQLLAIHSSLEEFKMAYFLNKHLQITLSRARLDLDYNHGSVEATYPLYVYKDEPNYRTYYLIKNSYKGSVKKVTSSGSLFIEEELSPHTTYLIPEYKDVDFFFKIDEEIGQEDLQRLVGKISAIPKIVTVYAVDASRLKSKNNLILE